MGGAWVYRPAWAAGNKKAGELPPLLCAALAASGYNPAACAYPNLQTTPSQVWCASGNASASASSACACAQVNSASPLLWANATSCGARLCHATATASSTACSCFAVAARAAAMCSCVASSAHCAFGGFGICLTPLHLAGGGTPNGLLRRPAAVMVPHRLQTRNQPISIVTMMIARATIGYRRDRRQRRDMSPFNHKENPPSHSFGMGDSF